MVHYLTEVKFIAVHLGLNQTGHMSFLTGQNRTPKFSGQVLPDRTEFELKNFTYQVWLINFHRIRSLDENLMSKQKKS